MLVRAHAKLNLALAVGPPITDHGSPQHGYHPIASWFVAVDLCDELSLTALPPGNPARLTIRWADDAVKPSPIDWPVERDLTMRAHAALQSAVGRELPAELELVKRIPVGAGMGGGSSDCAAALSGLNQLFALGLSVRQLAEIAAPLGSDIAFFLRGEEIPAPAMVTGLGHTIERVPAPRTGSRTPVVLIFPPFGCPTGPVYKAFDAMLAGERGVVVAGLTPHALRVADVRALIAEAERTGLRADLPLFNDLEAPAARVAPGLAEILAALRAAGLPVHLTGSGSAIFLLAPGPTTAARAELCAQINRVLAPVSPAARTFPASILA